MVVGKGVYLLLINLVGILTTVIINLQSHSHYMENQINLYLYLLVMNHFLRKLVSFWIWKIWNDIIISGHDVMVNKTILHSLCVPDSSLWLKLGGYTFHRAKFTFHEKLTRKIKFFNNSFWTWKYNLCQELTMIPKRYRSNPLGIQINKH